MLARLRERKVVQWGLAYAAGAWALLQGLEYATGTFDWPRQIQQFASIGLAVGLPVVLVVAWYHGDRGQQRVSGAELAILSVLLALGGGALWLYGQRDAQVPAASAPPAPPTIAQDSPAAAGDERPSIAVLPFENRSDQEKDAFFVDGIHDDILTQLSKVSASVWQSLRRTRRYPVVYVGRSAIPTGSCPLRGTPGLTRH